MVHEEHLRAIRLPINEYKSRLSVARERGSLIRRFYDGYGTVLYNLGNISVPHSIPPYRTARTLSYPFFNSTRRTCVCVCTLQRFSTASQRDIRCKFLFIPMGRIVIGIYIYIYTRVHIISRHIKRYEKRPSPETII